MTTTNSKIASKSNTTSNLKTPTGTRINSKKQNNQYKKMTNNNVYEMITNRIIEQLENGYIPWENPNIKGLKTQNLITGHIYTGINPLLLQMSDTPFFMTYKQAKQVNANIKKGAKSYPVVFWSVITKDVKNEEDEMEEKKLFLLKYYNVFKISDVENLPQKLIDKAEKLLVNNKKILSGEGILNNYQNAPGNQKLYS